MALWSGAGPALASTEQDPVVVGDASAIEAGVEVRGGADAPFVLLEAVEPVAVGDGVRTDTTGFAEIAYLDGSRTRLDIDTEFEVVELTDDAGVSTTRTSMGVGRTWHRVESLGEGEFTVETSQATATVRGTAFVLDCVSAGNCSYLVFEGVIEVTLGDGSVVEVIGPAKVEVVGGVAGPVTPVTLDELLADPWLVANVKRDIAAGFDDLVTILGTDEAEPTTTELATTSTTTADTSTTTTEPSTSTTEESTSTTDADDVDDDRASATTTTDPSTTTTEPPSDDDRPRRTTTEALNEPSTTTTSTTTTATDHVIDDVHVDHIDDDDHDYDDDHDHDDHACRRRRPRDPPARSRHLPSVLARATPATGTTTWSSTRWSPCCTIDSSRGSDPGAEPVRARPRRRLAMTPGAVPPSTTTTTAPELVTESARPVVETTPPDTTVTSPPPTLATGDDSGSRDDGSSRNDCPGGDADTKPPAETDPAATAAPAETTSDGAASSWSRRSIRRRRPNRRRRSVQPGGPRARCGASVPRELIWAAQTPGNRTVRRPDPGTDRRPPRTGTAILVSGARLRKAGTS